MSTKPMLERTSASTGPDVERLLERGLMLEYATLAWNVIGCAIVLVSAWLARSVALAGFGLDSVIEIFASVVVVWQLKGVDKGREQAALRVIGTAFFALAIYILAQGAYTLLSGARPDPSPTGMLWLVLTCVAMLALAYGKDKTGRALGNPVLVSESRVTVVDGVLAGAVLIGLVLNALLGWWWADPLAGLVIVYYGIKEGLHAWRSEG
jgi:divalent metal cation (Fe/Co/Zn/Cd) transporter